MLACDWSSNQVLRMSDGIDQNDTVVWQLACLLFVAWLIIFLVLLNGVNSVGKVGPIQAHTSRGFLPEVT